LNIILSNEHEHIENTIKINYKNWYNEIGVLKQYEMNFEILNNNDYNIELKQMIQILKLKNML
jgi:hypothetical protein